MARYLVHIGTHKTGSTAIQHLLRINQDELASAGWIYLSPLQELRELIHLRGDNAERTDAACKAVEKESRAGKAAEGRIISHEHLSGDPDQGYTNAQFVARALGRVLEGHKVTIVVYLRPQDLFVESYYSQKVMAGFSGSFSNYKQSLKNDYFNYFNLVEAYANVFGREALVVKPYVRQRYPGSRDLLYDFLSLIDITGPKADACVRANEATNANMVSNPGLSAEALSLMRLVNPSMDERGNARLRRILQISCPKDRSTGYGLFPEDERAAFLARHEAGNDAVGRTYLDGGRLFPPCQESGRGTEPETIPLTGEQAEIERALAALTKAMLAQSPQASPTLDTLLRLEHRLYTLLCRFPRAKATLKRLFR